MDTKLFGVINNKIEVIKESVYTKEEVDAKVTVSGGGGIQAITVNGIEMEIINNKVNFELATEEDIDNITSL